MAIVSSMAAAARRKAQREEEMTLITCSAEDLADDWEFKIVRSELLTLAFS